MNYKALGTVAGLLLAAWPMFNRQSALPSVRGVIETVHYLPGRLRLSVPSLVGDPASAEHLRNQMEMLDQVTSLQVNHISGSVLIHFDSSALNPAVVFGATVRILGLDETIEAASQPVVWREMKTIGRSFDHALYSGSTGYIDVKTLIGLVIVGTLGYRLLTQSGRLSMPGTATLGWWLFNLILKRERP